MKKIATFALVIFAITINAFNASVSLQWDANTESDLQGYIFDYGIQSNPSETGSHINVGNITTYIIDIPIGIEYYFTVRAINTTGLVSLPSNEVIYTIPFPTYNLTVNNGTGDGNYHEGDIIPIIADLPEIGFQFKWWIGDTMILNNQLSPNTTALIPSMDVTVTAEYEEIPVPTPTPTPLPSPTPSPTPKGKKRGWIK